MARFNTSIIDIQQSLSMRDRQENFEKDTDINFNGVDGTEFTKITNNSTTSEILLDKEIKGLVATGTDCHINRALLWLASKPYDYVRSSTKGGVLYRLLGSILSDDNMSMYEDDIAIAFNRYFSRDLTLLECRLEKDVINRGVKLFITVRDVFSGKIFSENLYVTE